MALSGLAMVGFVAGHMAGNLLIFAGAEVLNGYAEKLHSMPALLWAVRVGLLGALTAHVGTAIVLMRRNRGARPADAYGKKVSMAYTAPSRFMALTGTLVLFYIIYHLAHFTWKWTHPEFQSHPGDVYHMIVTSFLSPWISVIYLISMALLGVHLFHGISSTLDTLGLYHKSYTPLARKAAMGLAVLLSLGFSIIPIAVWLRWVT